MAATLLSKGEVERKRVENLRRTTNDCSSDEMEYWFAETLLV
jgi:hypothetical protein